MKGARIEIDIDDYLTEEEKKDLCIEYFKKALYGSDNHKERILSNLAYSAAESIIDASLTKEQLHAIKIRALEIIQNITETTVFRKKDAWGSLDSIAYTTLQEAMEENKDIIKEKVKDAILKKDYLKDLSDQKEIIREILLNAIVEVIR